MADERGGLKPSNDEICVERLMFFGFNDADNFELVAVPSRDALAYVPR